MKAVSFGITYLVVYFQSTHVTIHPHKCTKGSGDKHKILSWNPALGIIF